MVFTVLLVLTWLVTLTLYLRIGANPLAPTIRELESRINELEDVISSPCSAGTLDWNAAEFVTCAAASLDAIAKPDFEITIKAEDGLGGTCDPRPWVQEHYEPMMWHYYPNGHHTSSACGKPPIPGTPLVSEDRPAGLVCGACDQVAATEEDYSPIKEVIMDPRRGDIAICSIGFVGIIDCDEPQPVTYPDGNTGTAWTGKVVVPDERLGSPWSSRNPRVIARVQDDGTYEPAEEG